MRKYKFMKLISLNVEGDKHWSLIHPFLAAEQPDVICLQEVFEGDVKLLADELSMNVAFEPMWQKMPTTNESKIAEPMGTAILSRTRANKIWSLQYHTPHPEVVPYDNSSLETIRQSTRSLVLLVELEDQGEKFVFATTHFTWTPDGLSNDYQRVDVKELLKQLESVPEIVLCGDFNMPRGFNDLYELFTERYTDAIPASYVSSLDLVRHRARHDEVAAVRVGAYMVDYIFLTKGYEAKDVRLVSGVSDHSAVVAQIFLKK